MKAKAMVFAHPQLPFRLFDLFPARVLAGWALGALAVTGVLTMMKLGVLAMPCLLVMMVIGGVSSYRLGKIDPHIETVRPLSRRFWRKAGEMRGLVAGGGEHE